EYVGADAALDAHGWFDTRDRGHVDDDGYLFIEGRDDETIIRGAENIAPAEIEDVLIRHPDVDDAVVVGLPDEEWGQRLAAVVVPRPGAEPDPDELRTWVRDRLRGSRTPDRVEVWPDLPRTDNGKVIRRQVTEQLLSGSGRRPAPATRRGGTCRASRAPARTRGRRRRRGVPARGRGWPSRRPTPRSRRPGGRCRRR